MRRVLRYLFSDRTAHWKHLVADPLLGDLRLNPDATWWDATASTEAAQIAFCIGGEGAPDPALVSHAHDIVRDFGAFERRVYAFVAAEAERVGHLRPFAQEIRQLRIASVALFWPKRPDDGMIEFAGPDQFRLWRCDYRSRQPVGLGFDD